MKILFESDFFEPTYFQEWIDACNDNLAYEHKWEHHVEYDTCKSLSHLKNTDIFSSYSENDSVVVIGSIQFCSYVQEDSRRKFKLVAPVSFNKYRCTHYYPIMGNRLLNSNYSIVPFDDLSRMSDELWKRHSNNDCVFIRPDDGTKSFTGMVLARNAMKHENSMRTLELHKSFIPDNTLCIVAEPQNIVREWRFVISNGVVITGSLYRENTFIKHENVDGKWDYLSSPNPALTAYAAANQMVNGQISKEPWSPDPIWTLDVCETKNGEFFVLEIGGFACAGLYACDRKRILDRLMEIANERA